MSAYTNPRPTYRFSYHIHDLIGPGLGAGIAGFEPARSQPYTAGRGLRFGAPSPERSSGAGFTEIVKIADGLHAVIMDWPSDPNSRHSAVWAEASGAEYGYLYIGLEGDGRLEVEGLGTARRPGSTCSLTVTPPDSTYLWSAGPNCMHRGVSIAFHAT